MDLSLIIQFISTFSISPGILNQRNFQAMRRRECTTLMQNSFQTSDFVRGLLLIFDLPDSINTKRIEKLTGTPLICLSAVIGAWERLGILVYRREIELDMVDDACSGPIIQSWQKPGAYSREFLARLQRKTAFELPQWLAKRMLEREQGVQPLPDCQAY
jgi:hypothetical protein